MQHFWTVGACVVCSTVGWDTRLPLLLPGGGQWLHFQCPIAGRRKLYVSKFQVKSTTKCNYTKSTA